MISVFPYFRIVTCYVRECGGSGIYYNGIWSDIFGLENLSVWQIKVFQCDLLMRNWGYIECETWEKQCWSYLRNIRTAINYFFYKRFAHNLLIFLIGNIWLNIGICQTLGFSILKMSPLKSKGIISLVNCVK
jgi:hypothetical protein